MSCAAGVEADAAFLADFTRRAMLERIPLDGSIELTHRCNLRCVHCFLGDQSSIRTHRAAELDTEEVKALLDDLVDAGTLNLTFTGGDPMVRRDFAELYEHAVRRGLLVTVFCDAVLVTDEIAGLFERLPPRKVEVSIYGASAEVYESVTQVPRSFRRCIEGIERLRRGGHRLTLKTVLLTLNHHELEAMRALADGFGAEFYFDTAVFPCLPHRDNGDGANARRERSRKTAAQRVVEVAPPRREPLAYRLDADVAAEVHARDDAQARELAEFYLRTRVARPSDDLYSCGAGMTTFHVDPYGRLQACTISTNVGYDLRAGSFADGWNGPIAALRERKSRPGLSCQSCDMRAMCGGCPALFAAETGEADVKSEHVCRTTHGIRAALARRFPEVAEVCS